MMFDKLKFKGAYSSAGLTQEKVAEIMGINPATLARKISGTSDFTRNEIQLFRNAIGLSCEDVDAIFFAHKLA